MTSAQFIKPRLRRRRRARIASTCALIAAALFSTRCGPTLKEPTRLTAPYSSPEVWAVAPFANESGAPEVRTDRVADLFTEQVQQVKGLDSIPVNRVIAAMRSMGVETISTPSEARALIRLLGVDGLLVGTVTSYDAYPPPKLGAAVQLYRRDATADASGLDPHALSRAPTDHPPPDYPLSSYPTSSAAGVFDARHHDTLRELAAYAESRETPDSAYGTDIYLASMELYTQFVSYRLIRDLLHHEVPRLSTADGNR